MGWGRRRVVLVQRDMAVMFEEEEGEERESQRVMKKRERGNGV